MNPGMTTGSESAMNVRTVNRNANICSSQSANKILRSMFQNLCFIFTHQAKPELGRVYHAP